ncbi:hypothetical protein DXG01_016216, partial [Tephrocybe rancida]
TPRGEQSQVLEARGAPETVTARTHINRVYGMSLAQRTRPLEPVCPARKNFSFEALVQERIEDGFGLNDPFSYDLFSSSPLSSAPTSRAASPVALGSKNTPSSSPPSTPTSRAAFLVPPGSGCPPTSSISYEPPPAKMQLSRSLPRLSKNVHKEKRPSQIKKEKKKARKHRDHKRAERKVESSTAQGSATNPVRDRSFKKYVAISDPFLTDTKPEDYRVASNAFTSLRSKIAESQHPIRYKDIPGPGANLRLVKWRENRPLPLLDNNGRIVGLGAAQSKDPTFLAALLHITALLEGARKRGNFSSKKDQGRGKFSVLKWGFSHGGGRDMPMNLNLPSSNNFQLAEEVMSDPDFERLARHVSSIFAHWAPRLHAYYAETKKALCDWDPELKHWLGCVFAAFVCNLGPRTICYKHQDGANLPYGWCCVTPLGNFDPTRGGHIILWNLGIAVECPPFRHFFLPSSSIVHSNVDIHPSETRLSVTHYSAGPLFQFVERGMKSQKDFKRTASKEELEASALKDAGRWKFGLSLFSKMDELGSLGNHASPSSYLRQLLDGWAPWGSDSLCPAPEAFKDQFYRPDMPGALRTATEPKPLKVLLPKSQLPDLENLLFLERLLDSGAKADALRELLQRKSAR